MKTKNKINPQHELDMYINDNEFHSKHHSLFIENIPEGKMPVEDEDGPIPDVYMDLDPFKIFDLYVGDFDEEGTGLHVILNKLRTADRYDDMLRVHIDSYGGSVTEGKLFWNAFNNFGKDHITAYLNSGYSMGALLFCMADRRIVHEFSDFMLHDYSTMLYGKAGDLETSHNHNQKHLRDFFKKITLDKGFLSQEEFEMLKIGKEFWFDTEEMCKRGIATGVQTSDGFKSAKDYLDGLEEERNPKPLKVEKIKTPRKTKVKE